MDTRITIEYPGFRWTAVEKNDGETFLCKEWQSGELDATYNLHEDQLEEKISALLADTV
jgi:hypothetical protein